MRNTYDRVRVDVLVAGGGGAAFRAAAEAARLGASVRVVCKGRVGRSGLTATARSEILSIGAALGHADPRDNPRVHFADTMVGGEGFCDPRLVRVLVNEAPGLVMDLAGLGVPFERQGRKLIQGMSDYATYPRCCRVDGTTGHSILSALMVEADRLNVPVDDSTMVADLLVDDSKVVGAIGIDSARGRIVTYEAGAVVLATGGVGDAFVPTLSDATMTGDGLALCLRAGARLVNMEFHQLIPGLIHPSPLVLSKPLYRLRPKLVNERGELFLGRYLPSGVDEEEVFAHKVSPYSTSNPSRYIDEAIFQETQGNQGSGAGKVYYDFTGTSTQEFVRVAPHTYRALRSRGLDPARGPIQVGILFQLVNGGALMVNDTAMTEIAGLFVAGETAGGVRGPDRPGGNSLAEGQVFGARAGRFAARWAEDHGIAPVERMAYASAIDRLSAQGQGGNASASDEVRRRLKETMGTLCSVVKTGASLTLALERLEALEQELARTSARSCSDLVKLHSVRNSLLVCRAICLAALARTETRAGHYRKDFPQAASTLRKSLAIRMGGGELCVDVLEYQRGGEVGPALHLSA